MFFFADDAITTQRIFATMFLDIEHRGKQYLAALRATFLSFHSFLWGDKDANKGPVSSRRAGNRASQSHLAGEPTSGYN
jgi:hypothetical protein